MSDLEEFEAIKQVKYKYQRYVDTKNFEGLAEVLTEDAVAAYDSGKYLATGRKAIIEFLASALQRDDIATLHQVHCPELTLTSPTSATGIWYLHDYVINPGEDQGTLPGRSILQGAGFYSDQYVKQDGQWMIQSTGYERTFEHYQPYVAGEGVSLRTRWMQ